MKTSSPAPTSLLLPICVAVALATSVAPARAAPEPARTLDWSRAAPGQPAMPLPTPTPALGGLSDRRLGKETVAPTGTPASTGKGLFSLDDRAIIIVGGKNTTAGALKRALHAELAAKAGAPKTVHGGARKLDLAALLGPGHAGPKPLPDGGIGALVPKGDAKTKTASTGSALQAAQVVRPAVTQTVSGSKEALSLASLQCPNKGLPKISESPGRLKAGATATLWGQCFGERPGRVELIGQFPGGKLVLPFTAWDNNAVALTIPMTIRGAADHVVAVTVVTADGKTSTAMQAQFIAARERVEVPDRLWSPSAGFDFSATSSTRQLVEPEAINEAHAGHLARSLRVQPQCTLDTMDAAVISGGINEIRGWEDGAPNEASVTIDWVGTCINTKTTTHYNYVVAEGSSDVITTSACRVAFQARAWAYCPVGIAP